MGEIIPSESLSRVTYTGIDGMHSRKTKQPYIPSARKNRTIMKCAANVLSKKKKKKKNDTRKIVKMSRLCKAGLFFLRWITADPSPWGNFTYTGIDGMHSWKAKQAYIPSARKNRSRMKCAVEEDPRKKKLRRIGKMSPLNSWNQQNY